MSCAVLAGGVLDFGGRRRQQVHVLLEAVRHVEHVLEGAHRAPRAAPAAKRVQQAVHERHELRPDRQDPVASRRAERQTQDEAHDLRGIGFFGARVWRRQNETPSRVSIGS